MALEAHPSSRHENSTTHKQGFTLIEIAVAAAILLVLAGMAVPAFQGSVADAEVAATRSMLARVRTAVDFYAFQHQEEMPGLDSHRWSWNSAPSRINCVYPAIWTATPPQ